MDFKKIMAVLRKFGLGRSGTYTRKGDANERPIEIIMDGVYDANKDLINKNDISQAKKIIKWTNTENTSWLIHNTKTRKFLYVLAIVLGVLCVWMFLISGTYNFWLFANAVLWSSCIRYTSKYKKWANYTTWKIIWAIVLAFFVSFLSMASIETSTQVSLWITPGTWEQENFKYTTLMNPLDLVDIALNLETDLQLEDVTLMEVAWSILEIRTTAPNDISPEAITAAGSYIFSYIYSDISPEIKKMRLLLTINNVDAWLVETSIDNLTAWIHEDLSDEEFVTRLRKKNLVK